MQKVAKLPILLKELRLPVINKLWQSMSDEARQVGWSYEEYLAILSENEVNEKHRKRVAKYFKTSGLKSDKSLASFNFETNKSINKQQICALSNSTSWVARGSNLLFLGPSGVGKTHLAMAVGNGLLDRGIKVLYKTGISLVQELQLAKKSLQLPRYIEKLNRFPVLILDDIGYVKRNEVESSVLFELIAERYENKSLIITCNQPFSEWDTIFSDTAMTVAAIDRVVHHSTIINITGESFRKRASIKNNAKSTSVT